MIHDIDILSKSAVVKIYDMICKKTSFDEWRLIRVGNYWTDKDEVQDSISKMRVTIEYYHKYKQKERNGLL